MICSVFDPGGAERAFVKNRTSEAGRRLACTTLASLRRGLLCGVRTVPLHGLPLVRGLGGFSRAVLSLDEPLHLLRHSMPRDAHVAKTFGDYPFFELSQTFQYVLCQQQIGKELKAHGLKRCLHGGCTEVIKGRSLVTRLSSAADGEHDICGRKHPFEE